MLDLGKEYPDFSVALLNIQGVKLFDKRYKNTRFCPLNINSCAENQLITIRIIVVDNDQVVTMKLLKQ